jgi:hypothetical protein
MEDDVKELEEYARGLYINGLDNDPVDIGIEYFVEGFVLGVLTEREHSK